MSFFDLIGGLLLEIPCLFGWFWHFISLCDMEHHPRWSAPSYWHMCWGILQLMVYFDEGPHSSMELVEDLLTLHVDWFHYSFDCLHNPWGVVSCLGHRLVHLLHWRKLVKSYPLISLFILVLIELFALIWLQNFISNSRVYPFN